MSCDSLAIFFCSKSSQALRFQIKNNEHLAPQTLSLTPPKSPLPPPDLRRHCSRRQPVLLPSVAGVIAVGYLRYILMVAYVVRLSSLLRRWRCLTAAAIQQSMPFPPSNHHRPSKTLFATVIICCRCWVAIATT